MEGWPCCFKWGEAGQGLAWGKQAEALTLCPPAQVSSQACPLSLCFKRQHTPGFGLLSPASIEHRPVQKALGPKEGGADSCPWGRLQPVLSGPCSRPTRTLRPCWRTRLIPQPGSEAAGNLRLPTALAWPPTPHATPTCTGTPRMPQLPTYGLLSLPSGLCTSSPSASHSPPWFLLLASSSAFWAQLAAPPPGSLPAFSKLSPP